MQLMRFFVLTQPSFAQAPTPGGLSAAAESSPVPPERANDTQLPSRLRPSVPARLLNALPVEVRGRQRAGEALWRCCPDGARTPAKPPETVRR